MRCNVNQTNLYPIDWQILLQVSGDPIQQQYLTLGFLVNNTNETNPGGQASGLLFNMNGSMDSAVAYSPAWSGTLPTISYTGAAFVMKFVKVGTTITVYQDNVLKGTINLVPWATTQLYIGLKRHAITYGSTLGTNFTLI